MTQELTLEEELARINAGMEVEKKNTIDFYGGMLQGELVPVYIFGVRSGTDVDFLTPVFNESEFGVYFDVEQEDLQKAVIGFMDKGIPYTIKYNFRNEVDNEQE